MRAFHPRLEARRRGVAVEEEEALVERDKAREGGGCAVGASAAWNKAQSRWIRTAREKESGRAPARQRLWEANSAYGCSTHRISAQLGTVRGRPLRPGNK